MAATLPSSDSSHALRIQRFSLAWMIVEGAASVYAGLAARSTLLIAFGADSIIELLSAAVVLWGLMLATRGEGSESAERTKRDVRRTTAWALVALCIYIAASSIYGLAEGIRPEASALGIVISVLALLVMPFLAVKKRELAARLSNPALRADAAESFACAWLAAAVLVGLLLNALLHWWWADRVLALVFLVWLIRETWEAFEDDELEME